MSSNPDDVPNKTSEAREMQARRLQDKKSKRGRYVSNDLLLSATSKAQKRILPLLTGLYFFAILDRVNVGVAGLTMSRDLHLTAQAFGLGAGIFFIGYVLNEIPSNIMMHRLGGRVWLARIAITWGILAAAVALATGTKSFVALRFMLGISEAGFFPGVLYFMSLWFPAAQKAKVNAAFLFAIPAGNAIGAIISTLLLRLDGFMGLAGWQWLFVAEGLPPVLLGIILLTNFADRPAQATWLSTEERLALVTKINSEADADAGHTNIASVLSSPTVWVLGLVCFGLSATLASLSMWLPQLVHGLGTVSVEQAGFLTAAALFPGAFIMYLWSKRSDATGERVWHVAIPSVVAGLAWLCVSAAHVLWLKLLLLLILGASGYASFAVFWAIPPRIFSIQTRAFGVAMISAIGNLGAFFGPWFIGYEKSAHGSFAGGFEGIGICLFISASLIVMLRKQEQIRKPQSIPATEKRV